MGYRLFFILLFFVFFVEMTGAKPPKKKENEVVEVNRIMDSVELSHFSDSVTTVLGFCKREIADSQIILNQNNAPKVLVFAEAMPQFPGGQDLLNKFFAKNLIYPRLARENGINGTVVLSFIVTKEGEICDPFIFRSAGSLLDYESLRVLSLMPKWIPGKKDGQPINVSLKYPIKFLLK